MAANELVVAEQAMEANRLHAQSFEGSIRAARAAVQALKDLEAYLKITAPFDGVVTARFVHPGALVGPNAVNLSNNHGLHGFYGFNRDENAKKPVKSVPSVVDFP